MYLYASKQENDDDEHHAGDELARMITDMMRMTAITILTMRMTLMPHPQHDHEGRA